MTLLVVGTMAFDSVETPFARREQALGGSATFFSLAASFFAPTSLVGVVGDDFPESGLQCLRDRGIDLRGVDVVRGAATFRWSGRYEADMNTRTTLDTQLNVFGDWEPRVPAALRETPFVFLANGAPKTQMSVLDQLESPRFVVADTMNLWIEKTRDELVELLGRVNGLIINDEEARLLSGDLNLISAGEKILEMGPRLVIVKKGEHGSFLFSHFIKFALPAYPTSSVKDPTGAGDSFAGGFMGCLAKRGRITLGNIKKAMAYGTVLASIIVEDFSVDALLRVEPDEVEHRFEEFVQFVSF